MDFAKAKNIFESLYANINGYLISYNARKRLSYTDKTLTYGEILFDSFFEILKEVKPKSGEIFYDLGSGTGKAIFSASLLFPFYKLVGIEILEELVFTANNLLIKFNRDLKKLLPEEKQNQIIQFIKGNLFDYDFSEADVIFLHGTCFPEQLMTSFSKKCEQLKKESRLIIVTKSLFSDKFQLTKKQDYQMGWGKATVNFYKKIK